MADALYSDVCWIIRTLKEHGHSAFIAGGAVRDLLLGRNPEDYDIATTATPETIQTLFPRTKPVGQAFGTTLVIIEHRPYQLTTFQSIGGTYTAVMRKDILRRDFTVNALFWDPLEDRLIDMVDGMKDLKHRVLRPVTTAETIFMDDPVRMLRAARIAHALGFTLDPSIPLAIRALRGEIGRVSPERIHDELAKLLSLSRVLPALCPLITSRLLFEIIPELYPLLRLNQGPHHDFHGLSHTLRTLSYAEGLLKAEPFLHHQEETGKHVFMLAALLHDIGKPETHTVEDGRNHFYGHEKTGAALAQEIMKRLRFPKKETVMVKNLVARHLYPLHLYQHYIRDELTQRAIDRFSRKTRRFTRFLLLLATADQLAKARSGKHSEIVSWLDFIRHLL